MGSDTGSWNLDSTVQRSQIWSLEGSFLELSKWDLGFLRALLKAILKSLLRPLEKPMVTHEDKRSLIWPLLYQFLTSGHLYDHSYTSANMNQLVNS